MNTHHCLNCGITGPLHTGPCPTCKSTKGQAEITQLPGIFIHN